MFSCFYPILKIASHGDACIILYWTCFFRLLRTNWNKMFSYVVIIRLDHCLIRFNEIVSLLQVKSIKFLLRFNTRLVMLTFFLYCGKHCAGNITTIRNLNIFKLGIIVYSKNSYFTFQRSISTSHLECGVPDDWSQSVRGWTY